jgi:type VI secretion system protein ImpB
VEVTPDNFDDVLASMKPHLQFSVENKLSEDSNAGSSASISTSDRSMTSRRKPSRAR